MTPPDEDSRQKIEALTARIAQLEAAAQRPARDLWDRFAVASPFLIAAVGSLIAWIGAEFTRTYQNTQNLLSKAQVIQSLMPSLNSKEEAEQSVAIIAISAYDKDLAIRIANAVGAKWADGLSLSLSIQSETAAGGTATDASAPTVPWNGTKLGNGSGLDPAAPLNLLTNGDSARKLAAIRYLTKHPQNDRRILEELKNLKDDKDPTLNSAAASAIEAVSTLPAAAPAVTPAPGGTPAATPAAHT